MPQGKDEKMGVSNKLPLLPFFLFLPGQCGSLPAAVQCAGAGLQNTP